MRFLAQPRLRADAVEISDKQHADHQLRIDRGPSDIAVEVLKPGAEVSQVQQLSLDSINLQGLGSGGRKRPLSTGLAG